MNTPVECVAEVQGLYGPYSFSEKLLQKIWLRGDFDRTSAVTTEGRRVSVLHAGKWNRLGGPDFLGVRLRFDEGPEILGDVELHLRSEDWAAHGHAKDPAYDQVVLHVVLFPPKPREVTVGVGGRRLPVLVLLPLLHHDLEAFAADDAVEALAQRPAGRIIEELGSCGVVELTALLREQAEKRWRLKVHFARQRITRLGWESACHHAALEILGYRFNRAPMLRLAGRFPLADWANGSVDVDRSFAEEAEAWSVQGVRPANHPRTRLLQYAAWARARPDWPERLVKTTQGWGSVSLAGETRAMRREHGLVSLKTALRENCTAAAVGGTRFDTLVCDGWLPLQAARDGREKEFAGYWFHWFAGDFPPMIAQALRQLGALTSRQPACNGLAQGLLRWFLERENAAAAPTGRGA